MTADDCTDESIVVALKLCKKCGLSKPLSDFYTRSDGKTLKSPCKHCTRKGALEKYYADTEAGKAKAAKWKSENKERALEINRKKNRKRRASAKGRLENAISCGIRDGIVLGSRAGRRSFEILGYTIDELREHLEKQFEPGMTWENYGKGGWEVDHIVPKSIFNYATPDDIDFKRCWSLENLRPLWGKDNRTKWRSFKGNFQPSLAFSA